MFENSETLNLIREKFEKQLADYMGTKYAIVCSSGRSAIRFLLLAMNIKHGDEVIIPDYTSEVIPITVFCAGAVPKFCDIEKDTLSMSLDHFKKILSPKTKVVILIHLYGLPVDPMPILEKCQEKGLFLVDNAAQALGASIKGKKVGSFGNAGIVSFNKFLNVKLGGAILTDDEELTAKIRMIQERLEIKSIITELGYRLIEVLKIKSGKAMTAVYLGDQYISKFLNSLSFRKHLKFINGWMTADSYILNMWKSNRLTYETINQMMAMSRKYWHRRRIEKLEILELQKELQNFERYLEERRRIAKIYEENLEENEFSKIVPLKGSMPSYMRYPIIFKEEKRCSEYAGKIIQQGFKIDCSYRPLHESPLFNSANRNATFEGSKYITKHLLPLPVNPCRDMQRIHDLIDILNSRTSL